MKRPRLHVVTDDVVLATSVFPTLAGQVMAVGGDRVTLHVRGHATPAARLFAMASVLHAMALSSGSTVLINDRIDVAMAAGVHGVQLGRRSVPVERVRPVWRGAVIGYSAHTVQEVSAAQDAGVDFVMVGSIYRTATHPDVEPAGLRLVADTAEVSRVDIVAIGGVTPGRVRDVLSAGAAGVAVLSGIWRSKDVEASAGAYLAALTEADG